jgi:hypothetical protein
VQAVVSALDTSGVALKEIAFLILGTTVATNALLQRQGAYVLFLTTEGSGWSGTTHDGGNVLCPENGNCRNAPVEVFESKHPFAPGASRRRSGTVSDSKFTRVNAPRRRRDRPELGDGREVRAGAGTAAEAGARGRALGIRLAGSGTRPVRA